VRPASTSDDSMPFVATQHARPLKSLEKYNVLEVAGKDEPLVDVKHTASRHGLQMKELHVLSEPLPEMGRNSPTETMSEGGQLLIPPKAKWSLNAQSYVAFVYEEQND
jgi:hypothetical protein